MGEYGGVKMTFEPVLDENDLCPHGEYDWIDCASCHRDRIAELERLLRDIVQAAHLQYFGEEVGGCQWTTMPADVIQAAAKALEE